MDHHRAPTDWIESRGASRGWLGGGGGGGGGGEGRDGYNVNCLSSKQIVM